MRLSIFILIVIVLQCCNTETLPYYHSADFSPLWKGEDKFSLDTLHRIAPFSFVDQTNHHVDSKVVDGKIYVANFIFTACPGICPKMTGNLHQVQKTFSKNSDFLILSHSVMPWADSVQRLKEFAELHQINDQQWKLLTGNKTEIYALARTSYFAEEVAGFTRDSSDFIHTEHCLLVDRDGHIRGLYNGTLALEMERLTEDIRLLLTE
jgi:protein SCO1